MHIILPCADACGRGHRVKKKWSAVTGACALQRAGERANEVVNIAGETYDRCVVAVSYVGRGKRCGAVTSRTVCSSRATGTYTALISYWIIPAGHFGMWRLITCMRDVGEGVGPEKKAHIHMILIRNSTVARKRYLNRARTKKALPLCQYIFEISDGTI